MSFLDTHKPRRVPSKTLLLSAAVLLAVAVLVISVIRLGGRLKSDSIPVTADNATLVGASYEILGYIKDADYAALAAIAHPTRGVLFSPYATISETSARVFTPSAIRAFSTDKTEYVWGVYDGSAEPISLNPREYVAAFVLDRDFTRATMLGINRVVRSGNALENITTVREGIRFVDFHLPPETEDGDWASLRLGFEEHNGSLMLTVIMHSEKTV